MPRLRDILIGVLRRKWVVLSALGIVGAVVVILWVVVPRATSTYRSFRTWEKQQAHVRAANTWKRQLTALRTQHRRLGKRLDSLFVSLPAGDQMSAVLTVLQRHARRSGILLRHVRPRHRQRHATYEALPLEVALSGRYHSIAGFIDRIERSRYLIKVEQVRLQSEDMVSDTVQTHLRMNLVTLREGGAPSDHRKSTSDRQSSR